MYLQEFTNQEHPISNPYSLAAERVAEVMMKKKGGVLSDAKPTCICKDQRR